MERVLKKIQFSTRFYLMFRLVKKYFKYKGK